MTEFSYAERNIEEELGNAKSDQNFWGPGFQGQTSLIWYKKI